MTSGIPDTLSIALWVIGGAVLGLALVYAVLRAGNLRRDERERLDRATVATRQVEEQAERIEQQAEQAEQAPRPAAWSMQPSRRRVSYAMLPPILVGCVGLALVILGFGHYGAMQESVTIGTAPSRQSGPPVQPQQQPGSEATSDSERGSKPPLSEPPPDKSR